MNMKKQTLKWMESIPRKKLNVKNMVMKIEDGVMKFVPKHLVS